MKLWICTCWGNAEDGANGPDTNFLVRAKTFRKAVKLATACLRSFGGWYADRHLDQVVCLGSDEGDDPRETIVRDFVCHAIFVCGYMHWHRDTEYTMRWKRERVKPTIYP